MAIYSCIYPHQTSRVDPACHSRRSGLTLRALRLCDGPYRSPVHEAAPAAYRPRPDPVPIAPCVGIRDAVAGGKRCLLSHASSSSSFSPPSRMPCSWPRIRHVHPSAEMCSPPRAAPRSVVTMGTMRPRRTGRLSSPVLTANWLAHTSIRSQT